MVSAVMFCLPGARSSGRRVSSRAQHGFARLPGRATIIQLPGEDTDRFCCWQSESAIASRSVFPVVSPRRRRRSGEFPERPPEMYRIGKTGGLGHIVERGAGADQQRLRAPDARVELPAIGSHPRRSLEGPAEVRLRQARQRRQMREVNALRQVRVQILDDALKLAGSQALGIRARLQWFGEQPRRDRSGQPVAIELRRWIGVIHRIGEQPDQGPEPVVRKAQPRRGGRVGVEFGGQPLAQHCKIEGQGGVLHEARVGAVAPNIHAGRREVHVPGHIADRTGPVLAQAWFAVASDLFQQNAEAGFGLVAQMMYHPARAMEFPDLDAHAVPSAPRHRQAQHILRQWRQTVGACLQDRTLRALRLSILARWLEKGSEPWSNEEVSDDAWDGWKRPQNYWF